MERTSLSDVFPCITHPHLSALPVYLDTLFRQPVYLERDDLFVLDGLARVEGEGHVLGVTRWDDLGLEVVM